MFFAADASDCDATIQVGTYFDVYIMAVLGTDGASAGITGANFRVTGFDPGWFPVVTPTPQAIATLGSPLVIPGCYISLATCEAPGPVLLYTIHCLMLPPLDAHTLRVQRSNYEPQDFHLAPLVTLCDAPIYTWFYVGGGEAFLNGGTCTVDVAPAT